MPGAVCGEYATTCVAEDAEAGWRALRALQFNFVHGCLHRCSGAYTKK